MMAHPERSFASEEQQLTYKEEEIKHALTTDERVNEPQLAVRIVAGRVIVSGSLPTEERRRAVVDVVSEHCPGWTVENQTTVARFGPTTQEEVID